MLVNFNKSTFLNKHTHLLPGNLNTHTS